MTRTMTLALGVALGAIACVALLVTLARSGEVDEGDGRRPVRPTVRADLQPRTHGFGETVVATLELAVESDGVAADTVRPATGRGPGLGRGGSEAIGAFDPYAIVGQPTRTVEQSGGLTSVRYTIRLRCLDEECLPAGGSKEFEFPRPGFSWSVEAPPGRRFADRQLDQRRASGSWPTLTVVSGIPEAELDETGWRSALGTLPEATARPSAGGLQAGLLAGSTLLVVAAAGLLGLVGSRVLRQRDAQLVEATTPLPALEQALRLVEDLNGELGDARARIALETLAAELRRVDRPALAEDAEVLAWSEAEPARGAVTSLTTAVRAETDGRPM